MFIPVLLITVYALVAQTIKGGTIDVDSMKTMFADGEVSSFGWVPLMALCITIAGFIIFFENCRPFTKFRKVLYASTLIVVLLVLYLIPEFFIISGTDMLKYGANSKLLNIFVYQINHIGANAQLALYRKMTLEQALFLLGYAVLAYPIYLLNIKVVGWLLDKILFSPREFKDE